MKLLLRAVLTLCAAVPPAYPQAINLDVESKIIALERVVRVRAYETKDLKALDEILDESFVSVDPKGRVRGKAEVLQSIQLTDSPRFSLEAMIVRVHGETAIITGMYQMKSVEHGKAALGKGRFVDTWLQKNGRWMAIASLSTPNED
jgi:ketosteroid isomerase-like protein